MGHGIPMSWHVVTFNLHVHRRVHEEGLAFCLMSDDIAALRPCLVAGALLK